MFWKKHPKKFFSPAEQKRIVEEIRQAEERTTGEIRVHLDHQSEGDALQKARKIFTRLGMTGTKLRNGVLIYLAVDHKKFAIVGDEGIHRVVPENFWEDIKEEMRGYFREGKFGEGVCLGVRRIGEKLKIHFPADRAAGDELSNEISENGVSP